MKALTDKKTLLFAFLAALTATVWMPRAQALCFGLPASAGCDGPAGGCQGSSGENLRRCTDPAGCVMDGGPSDDFLEGGPGPDVICGGTGNDVAIGKGGKDVIAGGEGGDVAIGDSSFLTETDRGESCDAELVFTCQ